MKQDPLMKNRPCIYVIRNSVDNKMYVGKTKCLYRRVGQYLYDFRNLRRDHINCYLLFAMQKHGVDQFSVTAIEYCEIEKLSERELYWMKKLRTTNRKYGYNLRMDSSTGMLTSTDTSAKIRSNLKRQWLSGARSNHAKKMRDKWALNPDRRLAQASQFSRTLTKYSYHVHVGDSVIECNYKELVALGYKNILSTFHRNKSNEGSCKGVFIRRVSVNG